MPKCQNRYTKSYKNGDWAQRFTAISKYHALGERAYGFERHWTLCVVNHSRSSDDDAQSVGDKSLLEPATEAERAKSRTIGARRAKLPLNTYNKLLRIVREAKAAK